MVLLGAYLSSPVEQTGAQHGVKEQMFPYSEETSGLLNPSTGYSLGCAGPLHQRWLELGCLA